MISVPPQKGQGFKACASVFGLNTSIVDSIIFGIAILLSDWFGLMNISVLEQKRCIFVPANRLAAVLCCFELGISFLREVQLAPLKHIFDSEAFGILGARKKLIPTGALSAIAHLCTFSPALGDVQLFNNAHSENPAVPARAHRSEFKRRNLHQLTNKWFIDCFHVVPFPASKSHLDRSITRRRAFAVYGVCSFSKLKVILLSFPGGLAAAHRLA
jgi:hypothetical protein|nr:MAG TPA: hypothetical protein [Caudoviricetes sp.]